MVKKKTKKADKPTEPTPLDRQVLDNDPFTIADAKQFITDSRKKKEDWQNVADRSWNEIEKRNKKGRLYGGNDLDRKRQWTKFPLWWSVWKIRQPLVLARLAIPVLKDTQGDDPYGRTACVAGERLTRGILKTFDAFPEFAASADDFLITNFGWGRWFYRREECTEEEKLRLEVLEQPAPEPQIGPDGQPLPPPPPAPPIFIDPTTGEQHQNPMMDEFGPYLLTGQDTIVENEEVYFDAGLYSNYYPDPDARRYSMVTRLGYEYQLSYREFKQRFGQKGLDKLVQGDLDEHKSGKPIIVFEYHDKYLKEVYWFAENSEDFFQPLAMSSADSVAQGIAEAGKADNSDIYGLSKFFPSTKPLMINCSTKEFWPMPEFFQIMDLLEDITAIVNRLMLLTKAMRIRFFFDSSVKMLNQLIGETGEGGGLGIPNLEQSLMNNKGSLSNLVAYFPVEEIINGLKNLYEAFDQRLNMFYNVTGISDLIRGQTAPDSDKTFGERQMEGKYALNRVEPFQRAVQEWLKDNYQLGMEMALKNFSQESLDLYITPQTLDKEDQRRYEPALELLKHNKRSRFRVDFETDATISINEQWKRGQAIETANVITKMQESIAKTAQDMPELAESQLKIMQHVVGELTDGKLFLDEITESIEAVIEKVNQPKPPEFNKEEADNKLQQDKLMLDDQFRKMQLQTQTQIKFSEMQQKSQQDAIDNQLEQIKMQLQNGVDQAQIQIAITKVQGDIAQASQELELKRAEMLQVAQTEGGKSELETMKLIIDERVKSKQITLAEAQQQLEAFRVQMEAQDNHASLEERIATEQRLQGQDLREAEAHTVDVVSRLAEVAAAANEPPPAPAAPPITVDKSTTIHIKPAAESKPKAKPKEKKK